MRDIGVLRALADPGSCSSELLARMTGCSLAMGPGDAVEREIQRLTPATVARYHLLYRHAGLTSPEIEWLATGNRCRAADHLFFLLVGVRPDGLDDLAVATHPADARSWHCCDTLLTAIPWLEQRLRWVRWTSPEWGVLIDDWYGLRMAARSGGDMAVDRRISCALVARPLTEHRQALQQWSELAPRSDLVKPGPDERLIGLAA